ncbi:hypothetical protein NP233_g11634 [Leucocoprinus birnbaumii]|uniref:Uncharacterized protein n=1 Tax=Leucocoprinus birnbaumii TaxID=56174 RepID=A0AAD5YQS3_9AGAR|nr:hypothetical protein NP233_g11634 [Leucocoprinus birnbaumii]
MNRSGGPPRGSFHRRRFLQKEASFMYRQHIARTFSKLEESFTALSISAMSAEPTGETQNAFIELQDAVAHAFHRLQRFSANQTTKVSVKSAIDGLNGPVVSSTLIATALDMSLTTREDLIFRSSQD